MAEQILRPTSFGVVNPYSFSSIGFKLFALGFSITFTPVSTAYPAQNLATYVPFYLPAPMTVRNVFSYNGATVRGNMDIGLFTADGYKMFSTGPTQQSGTNGIQTVNVNWQVDGPGVFWMGISMSSGSATTLFAQALGQVAYCNAVGILRQASAYPLPNKAVMSAPQNDYVPVFGITPLVLI